MKTEKRKAEVGERVVTAGLNRRVKDIRDGDCGEVVFTGNSFVQAKINGKIIALDEPEYEVIIEDEKKSEHANTVEGVGKRLAQLPIYPLDAYCKDEPEIPPHSTAATEEVALNPILREIHWKIVSQTEKGLKKYGKPVHPDNHSLTEWIDHAVEESIDHITYLLMMKKKIEEGAE